MQDRLAHEHVHDVARVHINNEERVDLLAALPLQVGATDHGDHDVELAGKLSLELLHRVLVAGTHLPEHVLHLPRPPDLGAGDVDHSEALLDPHGALHLGVLEDALLQNVVEGDLHLVLNGLHPGLHRPVDHRGGHEIERLLLRVHHAEHVALVARELNGLHVVEELEHVDLDRGRVGRTEHREELVVRDKKEARERAALGVEVVGQALLALLEPLAEGRERLEAVVLGARRHGLGRGVGGGHDALELLVDCVELLGLLGQLQPNILGADEDRLEVHP
mmetsp:Transcript_106269/g.307719  ORF Transcript_106269/g.307719 Transcript_106269/m.307719 type:complete len:278 (-) Transcript_106269:5086-5919(-)